MAAHGVDPIPLSSKEHLGILNGTAFSASVASLALNDAVHLALLAQVCTAMGTEALLGAQGSFAPFIHATARPHPGQVEVAENILRMLSGSRLATSEEDECHIDEDAGELRQDRYPLRTAAQFLGPQVEDILSALDTVTLECNSSEYCNACEYCDVSDSLIQRPITPCLMVRLDKSTMEATSRPCP